MTRWSAFCQPPNSYTTSWDSTTRGILSRVRRANYRAANGSAGGEVGSHPDSYNMGYVTSLMLSHNVSSASTRRCPRLPWGCLSQPRGHDVHVRAALQPVAGAAVAEAVASRPLDAGPGRDRHQARRRYTLRDPPGSGPVRKLGYPFQGRRQPHVVPLMSDSRVDCSVAELASNGGHDFSISFFQVSR